MTRLIASWVLIGALVSAAVANGDRKGLADKHAPAGIMAEHLHERGEWMVEYKYMNMYMEDNRIGTNRVTDQEALSPPVTAPGLSGIPTNLGATPTQMTMEMHMMHVMYGATDNVTLYTMIMLPALTMDHLRNTPFPPGGPAGPLSGQPFTTHNSGIGDTSFGALLNLCSTCNTDLLLNLGCSVPTGEIFRTTTIPTGGAVAQPLPFPMRLGAGTFNARPGITFKHFFDLWSWGAQIQTDIPIGHNYRGYSVSDEYRLNTWTSLLLTDNWSVSLRGEHLWWSNYDGVDPDTPDFIISTNVEQFRGGYWYNLGIGTQLLCRGHYFNAEIIPTIRQDLDGIQLETDFAIVGSWSKSL